MYEAVAHGDFSINGKAFKRGDVLKGEDARAALEHPMIKVCVSRRIAKEFTPPSQAASIAP